MRLFLTFSKKTLVVAIAAVLMALLVLGQIMTLGISAPDGSTNQNRVDYIESLGLAVNETPVDVREIIIPQTFSDVYEHYNDLQIQAGFQLTPYKGKNATVYSYELQENAEYRVNLIVCGNRIIGGDVSSVRLDGEMLPLEQQKGKEKVWEDNGSTS